MVILLLACATGPDTTDSGPVEPPAVDVDRDGAPARDDCDDADPNVRPGASEVCNDVDDDCDGAVDEADPDLTPESGYLDADGDGWGAAAWSGCTAPSAVVTDGGDCDDADAAVSPAAAESCDGRDQDCDGVVDEACSVGLLGEREASSAESVLTLADGSLPVGVGLLDLDDNGTDDVISLAGLGDNRAVLVGSLGPFAPTIAIAMPGNLLLPNDVDRSWPLGRVVDRFGDGEQQLVVVQGDYATQLFLEPRMGMAVEDADLTVALEASFWDDSKENLQASATLVGGDDGGALVISGTWLDFDYGRNDTWVVDPATTGTWKTTDFPELGPNARDQNPDNDSLSVTDVGDLDGDGQDELLFGGNKLQELYMGPLLPAFEGREQDSRFGLSGTYDGGSYDGLQMRVARGADLDGDGRSELLLAGLFPGNVWGVTAHAWLDGTVNPDAGQTILTTDEPFSLEALPGTDGRADLLLGCQDANDGTGEVWREPAPFEGTRTLGEAAIAHIVGSQAAGQFGSSLATGDTNADGLTDVAVQSIESQPAEIYVFLGGAQQ